MTDVRKPSHRALKLLLAIILIVLGLAGLVLPFLQGALFLLIGVILLADVIPSVSRLVQKAERSNQRVARISSVAHRNIDVLFERTWLVWSILIVAIAIAMWGIYLLL